MSGNRTTQEMIAEIYTWMSEPDWLDEPTLEWIIDWLNRRPLGSVMMVGMLLPPDAVSVTGELPDDQKTP